MKILRKLWDLFENMATRLTRSDPLQQLSAMAHQKEVEFCEWCFGKEYDKFLVLEGDTMDLMNSWNRLHGHLFTIKATDTIAECRKIMLKYYNEAKNGLHPNGSQATPAVANIPNDAK